jgi:DNA-directed RNA polymerase subunit beta
LISKLSDFLTKDDLDRLIDTLEINQTEKNNYKIKGDYIDGLRIEITAVYERKISVGDKLGNRHGNKGIISKIVPHDQMPMLADGRHADIIINPLGITSRMNVGQVYETHLSMSLNDLKQKIRDMNEGGESKDAIYAYVIEYIKIIDKTENRNYTAQMISLFENTPIEDFLGGLDNFFLIQPPFESVNWTDLNKAMKYTDTLYEYPCHDPISGQDIESTVAFGFMYWFKLNHIAKDKISYRGIGPYSAKTSQPLGGKSRKGGQRLGEMEIWAVIAHGDEINLGEFISTKSDSIKLRNMHISEEMSNSDLLLDSDDDEVPQSLRLLQTNLKSVGLDYELNEGEVIFDPEADDDVIDLPVENLRTVLGEDSEGETIEIPAGGLEIGSGGWGGKKITYNVSDPTVIPGGVKDVLGDDNIEGFNDGTDE